VRSGYRLSSQWSIVLTAAAGMLWPALEVKEMNAGGEHALLYEPPFGLRAALLTELRF